MDSSLLDVPWFVSYAAEPYEILKIIHPHLNATTLPPPANPIRLRTLERRAACGTSSSNPNNGNNSSSNNSSNNSSTNKGSNTGVLIGAVVGSVVGTLAIAILAFVIYKKRQRKRQQQTKNEVPNTVGTPFKDESAATTPFVVPGMPHQPGMNATPPPPSNGAIQGYTGMQQASGFNPMWNQPTNTNPHLSYVPPPMPGSEGQVNYYNYAPPPPTSPQPTITSTITGTNSTGMSYYAGTPAPPFLDPHSTPSPPPPSTTPASLTAASSGYAPWAVPSTADHSGAFPTAAEEKAHYQRRGEWPDEKAQFRPTSSHVGSSSSAMGSSSNVAAAQASGSVDPRDGAKSPGVGITSGREGALSPGPPAYSPEFPQ